MWKINQLTHEQEQQMMQWRDRWLAIGRTTQPLNIIETHKAIQFHYEQIGKKKPFIWYCQSPYQMCLVAALFLSNRKLPDANLQRDLDTNLTADLNDNLSAKLTSDLGSPLDNDLGVNLGANLNADLSNQLGHWLGHRLENDLSAPLSAALGADLDINLSAALSANLGANLGVNLDIDLSAALGANLNADLSWRLRHWLGHRLGHWLGHRLENDLLNNLSGFAKRIWSKRFIPSWWWTGWYAYAAFPALFLDLPLGDARMALLQKVFHLFENTHAYIPLENICFISERPVKLTINDDDRLHDISKPALQYSDNYGIYSVNGVRVPADIINAPNAMTIQRIEKEHNSEIRRVMIELYGKARYIQDSGSMPIHTDDFGTLYKKEVPNDEPLVMVQVVDATSKDRDYWIQVPPTCVRAKEAVAWTFYMSEQDYNPEIQT